MDFRADYVVILSVSFPKNQMLVCFEHVPDGLLARSVLKSEESGRYRKVECRYLESLETGFEAETVEPMLVNRGLNGKPNRQYFNYRLQPIGHSEKPKAREILKFHKTSDLVNENGEFIWRTNNTTT